MRLFLLLLGDGGGRPWTFLSFFIASESTGGG